MKPKIKSMLFLMIFSSAILFAQDADDSEVMFKKAAKYFFQRKFEMAETMLQDVIKKNPENALAYSYLGDIFIAKKRYDAAINMYMKSIDLNPGIAENYFRLGQVYYYKKIGNLSIENFQKAVELDRTMKFSYYHIGLTYLMVMRDKENTIKYWESYLQAAPEDPQYESIKRVIELLRDPNFTLPPPGSDVSIEEALLLGGITLKKIDREATEKQSGHEEIRKNKKIEDINIDDDL